MHFLLFVLAFKISVDNKLDAAIFAKIVSTNITLLNIMTKTGCISIQQKKREKKQKLLVASPTTFESL